MIKKILINNPELMKMALDNYQNVTNPFKYNEQQKINFQKCILQIGNITSCYNSMIAKYGNTTKWEELKDAFTATDLTKSA